MKKIISLVLTLVMLVSVLAVLPVAADDAAEDGIYVYLDEGFNIVFVIDGEETSIAVAAKEMADYKTVGEMSVSIQDYAKALINDGDQTVTSVNLLNAMLGYGRAAANYFNYVFFDPDEGNIVIDGTPVTDTADLLAAEAPEATYTDDAGIYIGATLILEGTMKLRFYFAGTDITATVDGAAATATAADGYSYVDVAVMPYDMAKAVTVQAGATTVTYAPINYLKNKATDATLSTMVASIYAYGVAAERYNVVENCDHENVENTKVVKLPTLFSYGVEKGTCSNCGIEITTTLPKESATGRTFTADNSKDYKDFHTFEDILDGDHFYPTEENPNGQSLYIEFSMLWTEEFVNSSVGPKDYMLFGRFDPGEKSYDSSNYDTAFALTIGTTNCWTDNATPGYFDYLGKNVEFHGDYTYGSDPANCPYIGGYGWHRIGIVIKQLDGSRLNFTLYIDGVKLASHDITPRNTANLLYTGTDGNYKDIDLTRGIRAFYVPEGNTNGATADLEIADLYVTAGTGFVMPVTKLDTAEEVTYTGLNGEERENVTYFGFN